MILGHSKLEKTSKNSCFALGRQLTIEYYDCNRLILLNKDKLEEIFVSSAKKSGATVISSSFHNFEPQGVSGVVIIAESHFTVHAWPEHDYAAVDIFTCGDSIDIQTAVDTLKSSLESKKHDISSDLNRGLLYNDAASPIVDAIQNNPLLYPISWKQEYLNKEPWGVLTSVDIYDCAPDRIRDADTIRQFVNQLCDHIKMKRFGECRIVHFGEDQAVAGFSMTQLIETSLISGHFANAANSAYIDIFSCRFYEPREVAEFAMLFFKGSNYKMHTILRQ